MRSSTLSHAVKAGRTSSFRASALSSHVSRGDVMGTCLPKDLGPSTCTVQDLAVSVLLSLAITLQ